MESARSDRREGPSAAELGQTFLNHLISGHFDRAYALLHPEGLFVLGVRVIEGGMNRGAAIDVLGSAWSEMGTEVAVGGVASLGYKAALVGLRFGDRPTSGQRGEHRLWLCTSRDGLLFRGLAVGSGQNPRQILRERGITLGLV